jgi:hypothetical protein
MNWNNLIKWNQLLDKNGSIIVLRERADQTVYLFNGMSPRTMKASSFILEDAYSEPKKTN